VEFAPPHALFLFDRGDFKLTAFAKLAAAQAYFLSRLSQRTTVHEVVGGRQQRLALARCLTPEPHAVLEKAVVLGDRERGAARLIAVRLPEAIVNERRRQARAVAQKRGSTPSQSQLTLLAWKLFLTNVPATLWPPQIVGIVYSLRGQVEVVCKAWTRGRHLATVTTTTQNSTLGSLYGRRLLLLFTSALSSPLRTTMGQQQQRELSLLRLVQHFQAGADHWLHVLFPRARQLTTVLARACATAQRLARKAARSRPTSAQRLRDS
jgi:hypothetical protein